MNRKRMAAQVGKHEALRLKLYRCSAGKLTIGYGRNIEDRGIRLDEAMLMLHNDLDEAIAGASALAGDAWARLSERRKEVLSEMSFNLGVPRLAGFKKMWAAIRYRDWDRAADEMLDSQWKVQVGKRAETLAEQMRAG